MTFIILLAHISGKENSAVEYFSRMQTDPKLTIQIKITDNVPIREKEKETEAKAPNVSLLNFSYIKPFSEDKQPNDDEHFNNQLKHTVFTLTYSQRHPVTIRILT